MTNLYSSEYGSYMRFIIYAIYVYINTSSVVSFFFVKHSNKFCRKSQSFIPTFSIRTILHQSQLTLEMDLGTRPQLFPCCSWPETDRCVHMLHSLKVLAEYKDTNLSAQFNTLALGVLCNPISISHQCS